jgi:hypothetical protein
MSDIAIVAPRNIEESERLSMTLSKSSLLPEALRGKPGDILATLLSGAELGLAPMQSLRGIVIIKGKPSLSADLMGALVKRRKDVCDYLQLIESSGTKATYKTKRAGEPEPTTMSFTIEDAKAAGIAGDMYRKYPAQMLRARCLAGICRAVYPDLCMGLYDSDSGELTDGVPVQAAPVEKEVNPSPEPVQAAPAKQAQTEKAKKMLKDKLGFKPTAFVDVKDGETEQQAEESQWLKTKVGFKPFKDRLISSLTDIELSAAIDTGNQILNENQDKKATWVPLVLTNMEALTEEMAKRVDSHVPPPSDAEAPVPF